MRSASFAMRNVRTLARSTTRCRSISTKTSPNEIVSQLIGPNPEQNEAAKAIRTRLPNVPKDSVHHLQEIFSLANPNATTPKLSNAVLVAIDFENIETIKNGFVVDPNCQAGIAVLDTKKLKETSSDEPLKTYNFATGTASYVEEASDRFHFGKTVTTSPQKLPSTIRSLIPRKRDVIFVGHGVMNDILALQALSFQFPSRTLAALDTSQIAKEISKCWNGSLSDLLRELGCPHSKLHCAGNDANFALKALLLLAAKRLEKQGGHRRTVDVLRGIGRQDIPHWVDPELQATLR